MVINSSGWIVVLWHWHNHSVGLCNQGRTFPKTWVYALKWFQSEFPEVPNPVLFPKCIGLHNCKILPICRSEELNSTNYFFCDCIFSFVDFACRNVSFVSNNNYLGFGVMFHSLWGCKIVVYRVKYSFVPWILILFHLVHGFSKLTLWINIWISFYLFLRFKECQAWSPSFVLYLIYHWSLKFENGPFVESTLVNIMEWWLDN